MEIVRPVSKVSGHYTLVVVHPELPADAPPAGTRTGRAGMLVRRTLGAVVMVAALAACSGVVDGGRNGNTLRGDGGSAGLGGSTHGAGGTGGTTSNTGGSAGSSEGGASGFDGEDAGTGPGDDAASGVDDGGGDPGTTDGGGPTVDGGWVGPIVQMDCPGDPTQGWTEYEDTFRIEKPYDLQPEDRYTFIDGIYTFWIYPTDKPHAVGNTTAPRIETHYTNFTTGRKMWTADVMVESPSTHTVIFQVHTTASGAGPVYLRIEDGDLEELDGTVLARGLYGKWFNLKVDFTAPDSDAIIYVNNCQKMTMNNSRPGSRDFYFKNGVYTCESSICRDHFKNVHLYQK
jgi:hypothetical protein